MASPAHDPHPPALREVLRKEDSRRVRELVTRTGKFTSAEVEIAVELVEEALQRGDASGYRFVLATASEDLLGYTCYGEIAGTTSSFDLYWIAVDPGAQRSGLGRRLLLHTERRVVERGGRRLYADTSGRPDYAPTRAFYASCGYRTEARLEDFYAPGDPKLILVREL